MFYRVLVGIVSVVLYSHCITPCIHQSPTLPSSTEPLWSLIAHVDGAAVDEFCSKRAASGPTELLFWRASCCHRRRRRITYEPSLSCTVTGHSTGTAHSQRAFRSSPTGEALKLTSARSASWTQSRTRVRFIPGAVYNVLVSRQNPDAISHEGKLKGKHTKKWNLNG